jgi:hypothetical protein
MTVKGFRVDKIEDFIQLADQVSSPKFLDGNNALAFFYARKRIEYVIQEKEDIDRLAKRGFIAGTEIEVFEPW